jgi:predicted ATPase/DNA-binding SARP family transcriptional activator/Flp pilus assembly protein TadD
MARNDKVDVGSDKPAVPPARLILSLLGPPRVAVQGRTVVGPNRPRTLALLAYLAVEAHRAHERGALAVLLWPDQPEKQAFQNLRQTLFRLRRAISDGVADQPHLLVGPKAIQFDRHSDYWLDVEVFRELLAHTKRHPHRRLDVCPVCLSRLVEAAELYRGDFMGGFYASGSLVLDEWLLIEREELRQQTCAALHALASAHLAQGEPEAACRYAKRLLHLNPWDEVAQRLAMRALVLGEGRNVALHHYRAFRQALAEELGVEPEEETRALAAQIATGQVPEEGPQAPVSRIPMPATPLVGREAQQEQIGELLAGREQRLLTLYGPGGCGKTRLALEIAAGQVPLWRDGVWFVPLVEVPSAEALVDALAVALDLPAGDKPLEMEHLVDFLRPRELLLVLDGFEHLVAGASLVGDIVRWAPEVRILVTSRTRLGEQGEWALSLAGLGLPTGEPPTVTEAEGYGAVQLFVQSARRVDPAFQLTAGNLPHVVRICRLVEGLPLGIELAAAWVRLFHCRQIADQIEGSPDFLRAPGIDGPQGRHSLRGAFEYSYNLLSESEQALFRKLSVFRGGFVVEAARQVAGADPRGLDSLLDKSLLQVSPSRRLDLHLTLREYAAEKLAGNPGEEARTRAQHGRFYLSFLREREEATAGERGREALDQIQGEMANVCAAWDWGVARDEIEALRQSAPILGHYYNRTGLFREGETAFRNAAEHLFGASPVPDSPAARHLLARLRLEQARFLFGLGEYTHIPEHTQAAITLAAACQDRTIEAQAELFRGYVHHNQGELAPARACFERALSLSRTGSPDGGPPVLKNLREVEANSLNSLAMVSKRLGKYDEAERYLEQSLRAAREVDDLAGQCRALNGLGSLVSRRGDFFQALACYQEALRAARTCGDRRLEGSLVNNLGNIHLRLGSYDEAGAHYEKALEIQRGIGARQKEISAWFNLGLLHHYPGEQETARSRVQQALEIAQEVGDRRSQGFAWMGMGHALLGLGLFDEAHAAYQESVTLRRELGQIHLTAEPLAGLARVSLAQGDPGQAQAHVEEILDHLGSGGTLEGAISPFQVYLTCCRVLEANQDGRAPAVLDTAHDLLQEQAGKITDEKMRHSFLENVAAHGGIVQAWQEGRLE